MLPDPAWIDDRHFRVDDVEFVYSSADSTVEQFCIRKPRRLVEATVALLRRFDAPRTFELGIARGGSTALIALAGGPKKLVAVELDAERILALDALIGRRDWGEVIRPFYGVDQGDRARLAAIADDEFGADPLDLVIDDASHRLDETRASFETLFPRLRPGGLYVIEDWNWQLQLRFALAGRPGDVGAGATDRSRDVADFLHDERESGRVALRDYIRENADRGLLESLALELVIARACSSHVVDEVTVGESWVTVRRGSGDLDPTSFRLAANYVAPPDLLGRGEV